MTDTTRCRNCGRDPRGCVCLSPAMYEDASTIGLAMQQNVLEVKLSEASEYGGIPDVHATAWFDRSVMALAGAQRAMGRPQ